MAGEPISVYEVGKPYIAGRTNWAEAAEYNWRQDHHELRFFFKNPSAAEVVGITRGSAEFAVTVTQGVIFFLYQFGTHPASARKAVPWSDSPFNWWLVPEGQRTLPNPEPGSEKRALFSIVLVDAGTGLILGLRSVSLPPDLTASLEEAIRGQATKPFVGQSAWDAAITRAYSLYPDTLAMVRDARARGKGGF